MEIIQAAIRQEDRKKFDEMLDYSRLYNSAGSNSTRSQLIHPILMSILLEHYKQLNRIVSEVEK